MLFVALMRLREGKMQYLSNSPSEGPSVNPWPRRQSEGVIHGCKFGEKILQDWSETATLEVKIGAVTVGELIF